MAKLRHIALSVADAEVARKFFEQAFDMQVVGKPQSRGYYMSDGTINVALLERDGRPLGWEKDEPFFGIDHFGMWVDDIESAVAVLRTRGVVFEEYDLPGLTTVNGIATIEGNYPSKGVGERGAWFRDSEGNLLSLGQPVRA